MKIPVLRDAFIKNLSQFIEANKDAPMIDQLTWVRNIMEKIDEGSHPKYIETLNLFQDSIIKNLDQYPYQNPELMINAMKILYQIRIQNSVFKFAEQLPGDVRQQKGVSSSDRKMIQVIMALSENVLTSNEIRENLRQLKGIEDLKLSLESQISKISKYEEKEKSFQKKPQAPYLKSLKDLADKYDKSGLGKIDANSLSDSKNYVAITNFLYENRMHDEILGFVKNSKDFVKLILSTDLQAAQKFFSSTTLLNEISLSRQEVGKIVFEHAGSFYSQHSSLPRTQALLKTIDSINDFLKKLWVGANLLQLNETNKDLFSKNPILKQCIEVLSPKAQQQEKEEEKPKKPEKEERQYQQQEAFKERKEKEKQTESYPQQPSQWDRMRTETLDAQKIMLGRQANDYVDKKVDLYAVLGIDKNAEDNAIKKGFRVKMLELQKRVQTNEIDASQEKVENLKIQAAKDILLDSDVRKVYDEAMAKQSYGFGRGYGPRT